MATAIDSSNVFSSVALAMREPERVVHLELTARRVRFPDEVLALPNLEKLTLKGTRIDSLPDALASLTKLASVELVGNRFTGVPPALAHMPALRELRLLEPLTSLAGLGEMRALRSLELGGIRVALGPEVFSLADLEELSLRSYRFGELPPDLAQLTELRRFSLSASGCKTLPPWFARFAKLRALVVEGGEHRGVPAVIAEMPALEELTLQFFGGPPEGFDALARTRLTRLVMNEMKVALAEEPGALASTLTELNLRGCDLDAVPQMVRGLSVLEKLDVSKNRIDWRPGAFASLAALRELDVATNAFARMPDMPDSLASLRKLRLDHNPLASLDGSVLGAMHGLEELSIAGIGSPLASLPWEIGTLAALKSLDVSGHPSLKSLPNLSGLRSLEELNVRGNGLTTLPDSLGELTKLRKLVLAGNKLTHIDDVALSKLAELRVLELEGGDLRELPPSIFTRPQLEELTLLDYGVIGSGPGPLPAVRALTKLRRLRIGPSFSALPADFSGLTQLEAFHWRFPRLDRFPEALGALVSLRKIEITGHLFQKFASLGALPESLGALTQLQELNLSNTGVTSVPDSLTACRALSRLDLSANAIGRLPDAIGDLAELDVLSLRDCGLTSIPESLGRCATLRCLFLDGNPVGTLPDSCAGLTGLETLNLSRCNLTSLPRGVAELRDLSSLQLTENVFDATAMSALDAFAKAQRLGYLSIDAPRKAPKPPKTRRVTGVSKSILDAVRKLGVVLPEDAATLTGMQLLSRVRWPAHDFEPRPRAPNAWQYGSVCSFQPPSPHWGTGNETPHDDDHEKAPYQKIGATSHHELLVRSDDDAADPEILFFEMDEGAEPASGTRLSAVLAGLKIKK